MNQSNLTRTRCILVTEHLSHYRTGVYRELDASSRWEFTFIGGESVKDGSIAGIPTDAVKHQKKVKNTWILNSILWQRGLLKASLNNRSDTAIFTGNVRYLSTWISALVLRLRGAHVLFWTTGWHTRDTNKVLRIIRKLFYKIPHHLLLYGEDGRDIALAEGLPQEKLHVIGNSYSPPSPEVPIEDEGYSIPIPPKLDNHWYLGAVIRLNPVKRLSMLIEAAALLRERGENVSVILVGEGSAKDDLRAAAKAYNVPLYLPGGTHAPGTLRKVYEVLDVTVVPEYAGLTTIQSLEHGVPVVTTSDKDVQAPEFRAVIPARTGALFQKGNAISLADAIDRTLRALEKDEQAISAACQEEAVKRWSPHAHAQSILTVLDDFIAEEK